MQRRDDLRDERVERAEERRLERSAHQGMRRRSGRLRHEHHPVRHRRTDHRVRVPGRVRAAAQVVRVPPQPGVPVLLEDGGLRALRERIPGGRKLARPGVEEAGETTPGHLRRRRLLAVEWRGHGGRRSERQPRDRYQQRGREPSDPPATTGGWGAHVHATSPTSSSATRSMRFDAFAVVSRASMSAGLAPRSTRILSTLPSTSRMTNSR